MPAQFRRDLTIFLAACFPAGVLLVPDTPAMAAAMAPTVSDM